MLVIIITVVVVQYVNTIVSVIHACPFDLYHQKKTDEKKKSDGNRWHLSLSYWFLPSSVSHGRFGAVPVSPPDTGQICLGDAMMGGVPSFSTFLGLPVI